VIERMCILFNLSLIYYARSNYLRTDGVEPDRGARGRREKRKKKQLTVNKEATVGIPD
jgi:hypothetical protein